VESQENQSFSEDLSKVEDDDPQRRLGVELTAEDPSLGWREEEKDAHTLQQATSVSKEARKGSQTIIELSDYSVH
jgi:hypothetical protein